MNFDTVSVHDPEDVPSVIRTLHENTASSSGGQHSPPCGRIISSSSSLPGMRYAMPNALHSEWSASSTYRTILTRSATVSPGRGSRSNINATQCNMGVDEYYFYLKQRYAGSGYQASSTLEPFSRHSSRACLASIPAPCAVRARPTPTRNSTPTASSTWSTASL